MNPTGIEERNFWGHAALEITKTLIAECFASDPPDPTATVAQAAAFADALVAEYKKRNKSQP